MWSTYRELSRDIFPSATYVVAKYHYASQVLWVFEAIRKEIQKDFYDERRKYFKCSKTLLIKHYRDLNKDQKHSLNVMLYTSEKLSNAYYLKENFYEVMASTDYDTAKERLTRWMIHAENSGLHHFISVAPIINNWISGILNSFTTPYTNGYTEGINNKIKVLKRNAYRYRNFERFRSRILHMCKYTKIAKMHFKIHLSYYITDHIWDTTTIDIAPLFYSFYLKSVGYYFFHSNNIY